MPERWSESGDSRQGGAAISRCVVLSHPDAPVPDALIEAMARRRVTVGAVHTFAAAMVEIARSHAGILVIAEPARLERVGALLAAVRRYHPAVLCWQFIASHGGQISRILTPAESAATIAGEMVNGTDTSPRRLVARARRPVARETVESAQFAPSSAPQGPRGNGHRDEEPITGPLLTPEELDMLLGEAVTPDGGMIEERTGD